MTSGWLYRPFQTRAAASPMARSPTVTRRVGGTFNSNVDTEQSRRPAVGELRNKYWADDTGAPKGSPL